MKWEERIDYIQRVLEDDNHNLFDELEAIRDLILKQDEYIEFLLKQLATIVLNINKIKLSPTKIKEGQELRNIIGKLKNE